MAYAEPRHGATDGTGDHRRSERRGITSQLLSGHLLDGFVDTEVQRRAHRVAHAVETKAGVQTAEPVALDNLLDGCDRAKTGLAAQRRVASCIGGSLRAVRHQDRGLDNILGQFERACKF